MAVRQAAAQQWRRWTDQGPREPSRALPASKTALDAIALAAVRQFKQAHPAPLEGCANACHQASVRCSLCQNSAAARQR